MRTIWSELSRSHAKFRIRLVEECADRLCRFFVQQGSDFPPASPGSSLGSLGHNSANDRRGNVPCWRVCFPPITMVPLLLSNNPLTRAKYASVGARAKSPFEGHRGKIPGPKFTVGRPGQVTPTNQIAGPHLLHRSNECPFAHSGAVQVYQSVIVPGLGNAEEVIHLAGC